MTQYTSGCSHMTTKVRVFKVRSLQAALNHADKIKMTRLCFKASDRCVTFIQAESVHWTLNCFLSINQKPIKSPYRQTVTFFVLWLETTWHLDHGTECEKSIPPYREDCKSHDHDNEIMRTFVPIILDRLNFLVINKIKPLSHDTFMKPVTCWLSSCER